MIWLVLGCEILLFPTSFSSRFSCPDFRHVLRQGSRWGLEARIGKGGFYMLSGVLFLDDISLGSIHNFLHSNQRIFNIFFISTKIISTKKDVRL